MKTAKESLVEARLRRRELVEKYVGDFARVIENSVMRGETSIAGEYPAHFAPGVMNVVAECFRNLGYRVQVRDADAMEGVPWRFVIDWSHADDLRECFGFDVEGEGKDVGA